MKEKNYHNNRQLLITYHNGNTFINESDVHLSIQEGNLRMIKYPIALLLLLYVDVIVTSECIHLYFLSILT